MSTPGRRADLPQDTAEGLSFLPVGGPAHVTILGATQRGTL